MEKRMKVALVGIGKIARDQHVPALAASPDWQLAATVSRSGGVDGIRSFTRIEDMLEACPDIDMVSLCMPPAARFEPAQAALLAGRHVMLEKPPGATLAEVMALKALAEQRGVSLFATWHSRMAEAVAPAKAWLADRRIQRLTITWHEDVRKWHPGQHWVFEPGGMGVFDPGINALSIMTEILPFGVHVRAASLEYPQNCDTPIAAKVDFAGPADLEIARLDLDWRVEGPQIWNIVAETDAGQLALRFGGNVLEINGRKLEGEQSIMGEYPALYARMAALVRARASDVDLAPMLHVSDALTLGKRLTTAPFFL